MPVEEQVVSIYAGTRGYLDDVPIGDVKRFETELLDFFRTRHGGSARRDQDRAASPDDLGDAIAGFKGQFQSSERLDARRRSDIGRRRRARRRRRASKTLATE